MEKTGHRTAGFEQFKHFCPDRRVIAAQESWTPSLQKVNVLISIHIPHVSTPRFFNGNREGVIECQVVLYAARNIFFGFVRELQRPLATTGKISQKLLHFFGSHRTDWLTDKIFKLVIDRGCVGIVTDGVGLRLTHFVSPFCR